MTIGSMMSRMNTAEKLSIPQIQQAIKDGTLPSYIGVPMLQEKMKAQKAMQAGQQPQQQPPIAQQVMQEADQQQGIPQLQSNLPPQGMAGGGIVAFANGGYSEDDDDSEDESDMAEANSAMDDTAVTRAIMNMQRQQRPQQQPQQPIGMNQAPRIAAAPPPMDMSGAMDDSAMGRAITAPYTPEVAQAPSKPTKGQHKYHDQIVAMAQKIGLDPAFALKIANKETGNLSNPESAVSPAGALGVMQLMPKTARGLGVKDPMNPEENIAAGLQYAKQMRDKYGDEKLAAMAYNWGPGNMDKWMRSGKGIDALPRETRNYGNVFAEGGTVQHFWNGGLGSTGGVPITSEFMNEADTLGKEARLRLMREQARAAFAASPEAAAAPGATAAASPANYSRLLGSSVPGIAGLGGAAASVGANGVLGGMTPEQRAGFYSNPMTSAMSDGTGLAAAIQNSSDMTPAKATSMDDIWSALSFLPKTIMGATSDKAVPEGYGLSRLLANKKAEAQSGTSTAGGGRGSNPGATRGPMPGEVIANPYKDIPPEAFESNFVGSDALSNPNTTPATTEEVMKPSRMDDYLKQLSGGYEDIKKQKEEDRYLALLAAGLGMMGGTSPHAAANIGSGAMHGVSALMESNKQRAAEKAALDKSYGQGVFRQGLNEQNMAMKEAQLQELMRQHNLTYSQAQAKLAETSDKNAQGNLDFAIKLVQGRIASNPLSATKSDEEKQAMLYSDPLVIKAAKKAGFDIPDFGSSGAYKPTQTQESAFSKWFKKG